MAVVWLILKWLGIIILSLLVLFIAILAIVLFAPLRYELEASYYEKADVELKIKWLFSLIGVNMSYHGDVFSYQGHIFWKQLGEEQKKGKKPSSQKKRQRKEPEKENKPSDSLTVPEEKTSPEEIRKIEQSSEREGLKEAQEEKTETKKQGIEEQKVTKKENSKFSFERICAKINTVKEKKEQIHAFLEDPENKKAFQLIKRQLFRICKHILPRRFQAKLHFGFEDPALTGQVLGVICMFYAIYGNNLLLEPDFNEKVLEGECLIKGKIQAGVLLGLAGRLFFQKKIRSWIFKWLK